MVVTEAMTGLHGRTFAAVLFDNDGTLVDSRQSVLRSWVSWAGEMGVDPLALQGFHGMPAADIITAVAPGIEDPAGALDRITELELADREGVVALPGVADLVAALRTGSVPYAVATSATRDLADVRLAAAGIEADTVVSFDDVQRGKPAPDPFLLAAERLGADPADCLVVEDAVSGVLAGRAAGCAVLAVTTTTPAAELREAGADLVVDSLAEVAFHVTGARVSLVGLAQG